MKLKCSCCFNALCARPPELWAEQTKHTCHGLPCHKPQGTQTLPHSPHPHARTRMHPWHFVAPATPAQVRITQLHHIITHKQPQTRPAAQHTSPQPHPPRHSHLQLTASCTRTRVERFLYYYAGRARHQTYRRERKGTKESPPPPSVSCRSDFATLAVPWWRGA